MVSHMWGDEDFDFDEFDEAINYFAGFIRKYGRLGYWIKEKYGTMRIEGCNPGFSLHSIIYPGYAYSQFPKLLWNIDFRLRYQWPVYKYLCDWWFTPYQNFIFKLALKRTLRKWPQFKEELLCDVY